MEDTLRALQDIHGQLDTLKDDKTKYIKPSEIDSILASLRAEVEKTEKFTNESNQELKAELDHEVEDLFELISLFFLLLGRNHETPAHYALSTVILILMRHLGESNFYSNADLNPIVAKLDVMEEAANRPSDRDIPRLTKQLLSRVEECRQLLKELRKTLEPLPVQLEPLYDKLVSIRRQIAAAASRKKFAPAELRDLQLKIDEIDASRENGLFVAPDGSAVEGDQTLVQELFDQCKDMAHFFATHEFQVDPTLKETYDALAEVKGQLDKQALTQAWSLRETDLFQHMKTLRAADNKRVNGKFIGSDGRAPENSQKVLLYLLRKSYAMMYQLLSSSQPVSEALQPIYNQLLTLKKCLIEVQKSGGISSVRDLFPFSIKLASIDNMRKDGKFYIGSEIPEGQGGVNNLLAECFEICHDMRCAVEDSEKD